MISLHVFLLLRRLKADTGENTELGQNVFDAMFSDMDRALREMGSGDLGVAPRVKKMARAFYGRVSAYESGMAPDREPGTLRAAIRRNVYGTVSAPSAEHVAALRDYMLRVAAHLAEQPSDALEQGRVDFGSPPPPPDREAMAEAR
jgi:cytochrome b pre-mRNA-processing protein 3